MKLWTWILCSAAVLALATAPALAADAPKADAPKAAKEEPKAAVEAKKPEAAKPALDAELAVMAKECNLTSDQQTKLVEAVTAARIAMEGWQKINAEKLDAFKKAATAARQANDQAAFQKALDTIKPVMEEGRLLRQKHETTIMDILTPEQKATWNGFLLSSELIAQLRMLNPTEEQQAKVRTLSNAAAKELGEIKTEGEESFKVRQAILTKLTATIKDTVLTAEQRAKIEPPAPPAGMAPLPPTPTAPAPAPAAPAPKAPATPPAK